MLRVAAVDGPQRPLLVGSKEQPRLLVVDALVQTLDARHDAQPAVLPLAVQPAAHAREHVPRDEEQSHRRPGRPCGGRPVGGRRAQYARGQRARRQAHQVGDDEAAPLAHALLSRPLLRLHDAGAVNLQPDAAAAVLRCRLVEHAAVAAAEVPQHVVAREASGAEDGSDARGGARHERRERARAGGAPLRAVRPLVVLALAKVEGAKQAALLRGVVVDDGGLHMYVLCI